MRPSCALLLVVAADLLARDVYALRGVTPSPLTPSPLTPLLTPPPSPLAPPQRPRRAVLASGLAASAFLGPLQPSAAAPQRGLLETLAARDPLLLRKPQFNIPPKQTPFPDWLEGDWDATIDFLGFIFPKTGIARERLVANNDVPGFQKCSIAMLADVGHAPAAKCRLTWARDAGGSVFEDRNRNLAALLVAHLDDAKIVKSVEYDGSRNANRATVNLRPGSRNGERIELFFNSRRHEGSNDVFCCSESIRQVTLGGPTLSQPGVARVVIGEYQHFWTFRPPNEDGKIIGNLLTAAYIEPQDPMFQEVFDKPVAVYSHSLQFTRAAEPASTTPEV
ncbi:hypothetical protein M885DRAFT_508453 [Pelagophyceae sp. CCMP2097]|nr:hypothetical protein M885DRAFT_508453 [Pelagophyceae sp. CCMP2097]